MDPGPDGVILGQVLARQLGVRPGDSVNVVTLASRTPRPLRVVGLFASGMYDYDANLALVRVETAQSLLGVTGVTGIGVRVDDPLRADQVQQAVREALGPPHWVMTWMDQHRSLFAALKLEKLVMFLILTLIVLVACFTIVATLLMMVVERIRDIGVLKALGATAGQIRAVFTVVGVAIGGAGTVLGVAGGVGLCEFLRRSELVKLPPDIYYLDHLPVQMTWPDVGLIVAAAFLISWLACLYPAAVAARLHPVDALRYE
ncbi:MAG: FtsX-like permease family protein [Candidatus Omnitrophica bacterium]|nr:FtsX-like permease family protein [Candidatus Omnitrophota bacterium]